MENNREDNQETFNSNNQECQSEIWGVGNTTHPYWSNTKFSSSYPNLWFQRLGPVNSWPFFNRCSSYSSSRAFAWCRTNKPPFPVAIRATTASTFGNARHANISNNARDAIKKRHTKEASIHVGQIVKQNDTSLLSWPLGRIQEIHLGRDDITRVATVRTTSEIYKLPITRLCLLPIED